MSATVTIVAAVAENGVIGRDNGLPWRLPSDLRQFRALTMGKPVVMGRKTFASIGRPLDGRLNVVVSRDPGFAPEGVTVARDLDAALALARGAGADEVMVIGGADIYAQAIGRADRLHLTIVHLSPDGDARFPEIDPAVWRETGRVPGSRGTKDDADFTVVTYERRATAP